MEIKVTLALMAKHIPTGYKVRRVTGTTMYTLVREIAIHATGHQKQVINSDGVVYLIGDRGSINAYPEDRVFSIDMTRDDAVQLLNSMDPETR